MKGFKDVIKKNDEIKIVESIKREKIRRKEIEFNKRNKFINLLKENLNKNIEFFDFDDKEKGFVNKRNIDILVKKVEKGGNIKISLTSDEFLNDFKHLGIDWRYYIVNSSLRCDLWGYKYLSEGEMNSSLDLLKDKGFKVGIIKNSFDERSLSDEYDCRLNRKCLKVAKLDAWGFYTVMHVFNLGFEERYDFHDYIDDVIIPRFIKKEKKRIVNFEKFKQIKYDASFL